MNKGLYSFYKVEPLQKSTPQDKGVPIITPYGTSIIEYEIRRYRDLRNLGDNEKQLCYHILCTQRIVFPNSNYLPFATVSTTNYPAMVKNNISIKNGAPVLMSYSPRTINTAVETTSNQDDGTNASTSHQHTNGSSTSDTNSFGVSLSLGFMGDIPSGAVTGNYENTTSSSYDQSVSNSQQQGANSSVSSGDSMSIKDWQCNTQISTDDNSLTWIWAQEFPWDIIKFPDLNQMPKYVQSRLVDKDQPLPPSLLSQFGVDFTMKSMSLVTLKSESTIQIEHTTSLYTATHTYTVPDPTKAITGGIQVSHDKVAEKDFTFTSPELDLIVYALDPISSDTKKRSAIIGFTPNKFVVQPEVVTITGVAPANLLEIISQDNNLSVRDNSTYTNAVVGEGFSYSETSLHTTFVAGNANPFSLLCHFKIVDLDMDYTLYMKHWKTSEIGYQITILINDEKNDTTTQPVAIIKYVDSLEAEGGEENLLSISLRNTNFLSNDYHDYLRLGLNTVKISIQPMGVPTQDITYQLRALSIE